MYQIRTDLALETQEKMQEDHVELKGVRFLEEKLSPNLTVSTVVIETAAAEEPTNFPLHQLPYYNAFPENVQLLSLREKPSPIFLIPYHVATPFCHLPNEEV